MHHKLLHISSFKCVRISSCFVQYLNLINFSEKQKFKNKISKKRIYLFEKLFFNTCVPGNSYTHTLDENFRFFCGKGNPIIFSIWAVFVNFIKY